MAKMQKYFKFFNAALVVLWILYVIERTRMLKEILTVHPVQTYIQAGLLTVLFAIGTFILFRTSKAKMRALYLYLAELAILVISLSLLSYPIREIFEKLAHK